MTRTLLDVLDAAAGVADRGVSFLEDDAVRRRSWADLVADARAVGARLRARGAEAGDRVGLVVPDAEQFVVAFLGAVAAGLVPVPLHPPLSLARLDAWMNATSAMLAKVRARTVITARPLDGLVASERPWTVVTVDALRHGPAPASCPDVRPDDALFLQFTSGSTGNPRAVVVTHQSVLANAAATLASVGAHEEDVYVSWLPFFHDMGLIGYLLMPLTLGAELALVPTQAFVRRPSRWLDAIHALRGSITTGPNFAFSRLLRRVRDADLARWDLSSVKMMGCGAEPINASVMDEFVARFGRAGLRPEALCPCYGMAEATLAISFASPAERVRVDVVDGASLARDGHAAPVAEDAAGAQRVVGCGRAIPGHRLSVVDDGGRMLPDRRVGEIRVAGPSVTPGYDEDPEATAATYRPAADGPWLHTGDLGYLVDGEIFPCGRKKDLLIVHGRNHPPQAVEWAAERVEGVRKGTVVAFTVPGTDTEQLVVVSETAEADPGRLEAMAASVQEVVAAELMLTVADVRFARPGEVSKTSSGKLRRGHARAEYLRLRGPGG